MKQEENEFFDHLVNELKKLGLACEFEEQEESLIRSRIVLGVRDNSLEERLSRKEDLDLQRAENECRTAERTKM